MCSFTNCSDFLSSQTILAEFHQSWFEARSEQRANGQSVEYNLTCSLRKMADEIRNLFKNPTPSLNHQYYPWFVY